MTFAGMAAWSAVALFFTLVLVFLAMLRTGGDKAKLEKVPLKGPVIAVAAVCLGAIGTQAVLTNLAAVEEATSKRAFAALTQVDVGYSVQAGSVDESPFADIIAGSNDWQDKDLVRSLGSGEEIKLKTSTGKSATLKLTALGEESFQPVLTYDSVKLDLMTPVTAEVVNTKGFPQFLSADKLAGTE